MFRLILGRAGSGKSSSLLQMIAASGAERPQLLLVPEQASHEMERRLCEMAGNQASLYCEVLSFTRLSSRVFAQSGGLAAPTLDAGGRILLLHAALKSVSEHLTVYARPSAKPSFLSGLLETVDECKQYCVAPDALAGAGAEAGGQEGEKLKDLGLILGAYDAMTARLASDPRDRLTRLAQGLTDSGYAQGMDIYVDGFTDFTPQQGLVLKALIRQVHSLTVTLTSDHLEREEMEAGIFAPARRTAAYLLRLAGAERVPSEIEVVAGEKGDKPKALGYLEKNLFLDGAESYGLHAPEIELFAAVNPRTEMERTAAEVLRLVREENFRFRDIRLSARGFDRYAPLVEEVFSEYGIPVFLDTMTDVLQKPVFSVVTGALDVVANDFSGDDIFRYLKTGLTGVSREDCDLLENYALLWNIRGSRWTAQADWTMHPRGYGYPVTPSDRELLDRLNDIRRRVTTPLAHFRSSGQKTGREHVVSLYSYMEEIQLSEHLMIRAEGLRERGELKQAEEYAQLWEILCGALEQCAQILGEVSLEQREFLRLLKLVLSQYDVGSIPVSLDRVTAGEAARPVSQAVKALFFLGADEGALPSVTPTPGLLTDDDRSLLASFGLELSPRLSDKLDREMTIVYENCALPSRRLVVSWAAADGRGEEKRPSFLVKRLEKLFPNNQTVREQQLGGDFRLSAPGPALELAGWHDWLRQLLGGLQEFRPALERIERAAALERGHLSPTAVSRLYGRRVPLSASRMDQYKSCHFSYFMQYGLRAKARETAGFQAPEYGTFVHYVLEHVLQDPSCIAEEGEEDRRYDMKRARSLVKEIMDRYIDEELGGLENKTPRFIYLFRRLVRPVTQVVENVLEELSVSRFQPIAFELGFGAHGDLPPVELTVNGITVSISGFVDRVDGWVKNGRLYLRVMDYKTGRKSFDLTEVWNGLGLQMLLYLFTLEDKGKELYNYEVTPAGVLYLPAREVIIQGSRVMDEEERKKKAEAELRRHGLILDDPQVIEAMENPTGGIRFLPVRISSRTGTISGEALVTAQRLGKLKRHTQQILGEIGRELAAGTITADPFWRGPDKNACQYCDYRTACHFENGAGSDRWRYLPHMDAASFWNSIEGEQEEGVEGDGL